MWEFIKRWSGGRKNRRKRGSTDRQVENEERLERLRARGVRIGAGCVVHSEQFSTEPYLVELGCHVGVAGGVQFLTHDGSLWLGRDNRPDAQHFGRIVVGDNTYIGQSCLLLPGTRLGANCMVGAGSVVRGVFPDNSLIAGNPARVLGRASLLLARLLASADTFDSLHFPDAQRRALLEKHFGLGPGPTTLP